MQRKLLKALFLISLLVVPGCGREAAPTPAALPAVQGLSLATVAEVELTGLSEVAATVRAEQTARLASRTTGLIETVRVRAGDQVGAGQVLVTIEARDANARAAAAAGALASAGERLALAELTWRRYQGLYARAAVSRQAYDQAAAGLRQARAEHESARAQAAEAAVIRNFERLRAPFAGRVTRRLVDPGSLAAPGQVLLELEAGPLHLEAAVNEAFSGHLTSGQTLKVELAGQPASGRIYEINPAIDPASRSFVIKLRLPEGLTPASGAFARVYVPGATRSGLVVPDAALLRRGQLVGVYVLDAERRLRYRLVRPGELTDRGREIQAGLRPGEQVVSAGLERVVEGARLAGQAQP